MGPELEHSARGRGVLSLLLVAALPLLPGALSPLQANSPCLIHLPVHLALTSPCISP